MSISEFCKFVFAIIRQQFLFCLFDEWARNIGLKELREDEHHNLLGDVATVDPSEEGAAALYFPLSMLLAQYGKDLPNGSKFKVSLFAIQVFLVRMHVHYWHSKVCFPM